MIDIRFIERKDLPAVAALYQQLMDKMTRLQPKYYSNEPQDAEYFEQAFTDEAFDIFVADNGESVVGFAIVCERETPDVRCVVSHRYAYLADIAVDEKYQGSGVGSALINASKFWTKERGLDYLQLNVLANNTDAIKVYEHLGFSDDTHIMRCKI